MDHALRSRRARTDDLALRNDADALDGMVLYADLDESTDLVNRKKPEFAAEVYKAFLGCAARIIRAEGGELPDMMVTESCGVHREQ